MLKFFILFKHRISLLNDSAHFQIALFFAFCFESIDALMKQEVLILD